MATVLSDPTSPDVFLHAATNRADAEQCLVVEDAASGVEAALAAGMGLSGSVQWSELEMPTSSVKACQGCVGLSCWRHSSRPRCLLQRPCPLLVIVLDGIKAAGFIWTTIGNRDR